MFLLKYQTILLKESLTLYKLMLFLELNQDNISGLYKSLKLYLGARASITLGKLLLTTNNLAFQDRDIATI